MIAGGCVKQMKKEILYIEPVFKQMIWGGEKLGSEWNYAVPGEKTGECWGIAAHPNGDCVIHGGSYGGKTLSQLWTEHPELFGNVDSKVFPLLVKIIDARQDLSIQVHPDNAYAEVNEQGSLGKAECWYILEAEEESGLVIGHNAQNKEELINMIRDGKWSEFIREIPIKKGDFIQIDPGTIHAIKGGVLLIETQQNSDITYRVYDYDRLSEGKPRELHIEKSMDVITVPAKSVEDCVKHIGAFEPNKMHLLISCDCYRVWKMDVTDRAEVNQDYPFLMMSVIEGDGIIDGQFIKKGDHFIIPNGYGKVELQGDMQLICSTV